MDNPKVIIKEPDKIGKGLFAREDINKGEVIADWIGGEIYESAKATKLPEHVRDHAIQFEEHKWIDTTGIARYCNHSCEPNCGIKGKFQILAMRNIKKGEWLTFDYEMTEDSDWLMKCECASKSCRKSIGAFRNLPNSIIQKYRGYISDWLVKKYHLKP